MNQPSLTLTLSVTLKPGSQHDMVWLLQAMLAAISRHFINLGKPDLNGSYDEATRQAVMRVQRACGLTPDGVTDEQTWEHIVQLFGSWQ